MTEQSNIFDDSNREKLINNVNDDIKSSDFIPLLPVKRKNLSKKKANHKPRQSIRETILLIWLDLLSQSTPAYIQSLRTINDRVQVYTDESTCLDELKTSQDKIFFISSSSNQELVAKLNSIRSIEGIFVPDSNVTFIKGEYTKILGYFPDLLGLLRILKEKLERFQNIALETFLFEQDSLFQWLQSWKEEVSIGQMIYINYSYHLIICVVDSE